MVTSEAKDSGVSCPPNHIPELLMKELAVVADKEDEESRRYTEILLTSFAAYESDRLKKLAAQLFPICHRLVAKVRVYLVNQQTFLPVIYSRKLTHPD